MLQLLVTTTAGSKFQEENTMQSLLPNIWNSLSPTERAAIASGSSNRLLTEEEILSGVSLSALDELIPP
jgi:hypothetical protein